MLYLKPAQIEDCIFIFNLSNEYIVRQNSFNTNKISLEKHKSWFEKKLKSDISKIYIIYKNSIKVGQIRLDLEDYFNVISISIKKEFRGLNIGFKSIKILKEFNIPLKAYVKKDNFPSISIFEKSNFVKKEFEKYFEFTFLKETFNDN